MNTGMDSRFLEIFLYLGSGWVLQLLVALSVISVAIALERAIHFVRTRSHYEDVAALLTHHLERGERTELVAALQRSRSHVARILIAGLEAFPHGAAAVEETTVGATQRERLRMERGLAFLGTLGNNAPFIGLFGTVLGIIRAFRDLASNTLEGSAAVMAGIAEALVATAVGLLVALPAVAVFNGFQRWIRVQLLSADALVRIVLAHAKRERTPGGDGDGDGEELE